MLGRKSVHVSVIVPTWNECNNVGPLLDRIHQALSSQDHEVIVVDDSSPDGTAHAVEDYIRRYPNLRTLLLSRPCKKGLSGAVLDGAALAQGDYLVMMDADLSHDPTVIPQMLTKLDSGYDVVVGSRYTGVVPSIEGWPLHRRIVSRLAIEIARLLLHLKARDLTSGFAAFRRKYLTDLPTRYSIRGFKLVLEVLAVWPDLRVTEYPILFTDRASGKSKFGLREVAEFGRLCLCLWLYPGRRRHVH